MDNFNSLKKRQGRTKTTNKDSFDPDPYVDIIFEKLLKNTEEEFLYEEVSKVFRDPSFDFILGKSSVLSAAQKQSVVNALLYRVEARQDFDPEPYADEFIAKTLSNAEKNHSQKNVSTELSPQGIEDFLENYNLTEEQEIMVIEVVRKKLKPASSSIVTMLFILIVFLAIVLISPFYVPNYLQSIGFLAPDSGWVMKIFIGLVTAVVFFVIGLALTSRGVKFVFRNEHLYTPKK